MAGTPDNAPLSVGVIGAGYFAAFHVDGWLRNGDVRLVALVDPDTAKARQLLADAGREDLPIYANAAAMLDAHEPDIVDIAAPPAAHLDLIAMATQTRARAIVCQKPLCGRLDEARKAVDLAREAGKLLVVHENFRFQPWYREIRDEIRNGLLGDLYQVTFRLRPGDGQGKDAYLSRQPYFQTMERFLVHETAIHWIDTFRFLLGEPQSVIADLRRLNPAIVGEDAGLILYRYADGRRALFDGNRLSDHVAENPRLTMGELLVEGSAGALRLDGDARLLHRSRGKQNWTVVRDDFPRTGFGGDCVFALQKHVSEHLLRGSPIENEASIYLRNMEIEEAVYRAASEARAVDLAEWNP